jgi:hypothetical protein
MDSGAQAHPLAGDVQLPADMARLARDPQAQLE